jgi:hypothetical protein
MTGFKDKDLDSATAEPVGAHETGHASADHDNIDVGMVVGHLTSWVSDVFATSANTPAHPPTTTALTFWDSVVRRSSLARRRGVKVD